jgi:hypothetical protein
LLEFIEKMRPSTPIVRCVRGLSNGKTISSKGPETHLASTLTAEDGQLFEDLAAMINKPLGALARQAICVMLEKEKAASQEWRKAHLEAAE